MESINLLLSDARGQYIPRDFVEGFDLAQWKGIRPEDAATCADPENEGYWDAWASICDSASYTDPKSGDKFILYQDGDLWALCLDRMTDEEKQNFGFEE